MGVSEIPLARIGRGRSIQRRSPPSALTTICQRLPRKNFEANAAQGRGGAPTPRQGDRATPGRADQHRGLSGPFRSLVPGRAALKLFDQSVKLDLTGTIRVPCVAGLPPQPPFVEEGQARAGRAANRAVSCQKDGVTRELSEATPDS
jgi:hypothetical protein